MLQQLLRDGKLIRGAHVPKHPGMPVKTDAAARALPGSMRADVDEAMLLHGTGPQVGLTWPRMISNGLS